MSVYKQNKRPPHVVFLVDIQPLIYLNHVDTQSLESIQTLILRILLYYVESVDSRITWGYQLFNSISTSITMSNRRFHPMSTTSINDFVNELYLEVTHEDSKLHKTKAMVPTATTVTTTDLEEDMKKKENMDPSFVILKQALMQTLAEFQWKDIDLLGASPRSQRIRDSTIKGGTRSNDSIPINHYLYIISHRPKSFTDLNHYIYGHHEKPPTPKHKELLGIFNHMEYMANELKRWLWEDFANQHISVHWVDRDDNDTVDVTSNYIQKGLNSVMQTFGGCLIPETMLKTDFSHYGISFASLFEHYRFQYMSPNPTLNLSKPIRGRISSSPSSMINLDVPVWAGDIIFSGEVNGNISVCISPLERDKLVSQSEPSHQQNNTIVSTLENSFKNVNSLSILNFISIYEIQLDWLSRNKNEPSVTNCILWSYNESFLTLLKLLKTYQMVMILKIDYKSDDEVVNVEHEKLAIVECLMDGCAAMTFIKNDININQFINPDVNDDDVGNGNDITYMLNSLENDQKVFGSDIVDFLNNDPLNCINLCDIIANENNIDTDNHNQQISLDMEYPPCIEPLWNGDISKSPAIENIQNIDIENNLSTKNNDNTDIKTIDNSISNINSFTKLPNTIDDFTQAIQDLYLDTLYTTNYTLLKSISILLSYVDHILKPNNQYNIKPSEVASSLQSITMLSSEFDEKHRNRIPSMLDLEPNENSEQEHVCLATWLFNIRGNSNGNDDYEDLYLKALKIRDAKLQIIFLITTIQILKQFEDKKGKTSSGKKKRHGHRVINADYSSEIPEEQLEIYFDRMFIWEQVSNVVPFLQEQDTEAVEKSLKRLDQADIYIHTFCNQLAKSYSKRLPDLISKLMEKIDKNESDGELDDELPTTNKRRKTLLEMRIRGDSGETVQADWVNSSSINDKNDNNSQEIQKESSPKPTTPVTGASRRKETMFPILPFMKREINIAKTLSNKTKQVSSSSSSPSSDNNDSEKKPSKTTAKENIKFTSRPLVRRAGSFTKSALSPKRIAKRNSNTETSTFVLRKKIPNSPTTPRTRLAREFGISLTPQQKKQQHQQQNSLLPFQSISTDHDHDNDDDDDESLLLKPSTTAMHESLSPTSLRTKTIGIPSSPARSAARRFIGLKSPRSNRIGSSRDFNHHHHHPHQQQQGGLQIKNTSRDLTKALLDAKVSSDDEFAASPTISQTFSSLFDDE
ncbi:unnamed protein product [Cunninghamella blakesleeana]